MSCQGPTCVWTCAPGGTSCVNCGSPGCGSWATEDDCLDECNDDWLGLPRWFWYMALITALVVTVLGITGMYLLIKYSPAVKPP